MPGFWGGLALPKPVYLVIDTCKEAWDNRAKLLCTTVIAVIIFLAGCCSGFTVAQLK